MPPQNGQLNSDRPQIAILDFGSQYSHLIARRIRELHVYCELYSCLVEAEKLARSNLKGIILSGGPASVYEEGSPHVTQGVWDLIRERELPVLGICYGMQEIAFTQGGTVAPGQAREYGKAMVTVVPENRAAGEALFRGIDEDELQMWMSHGDKLTALPSGFVNVARTANSEHAAIANPSRQMYALQFHPEVTHSPRGKDLLRNFAVDICGAPTDWNMMDIAEVFVREVREKVGPDGHVIGAVSGGVDSSVAAALLNRAIGDRFHAVLVDNGCLRLGEAAEVVERLERHLGVNMTCIDASERFLGRLEGVDEPERKRKIIGETFIEVFQEEAQRLKAEGGYRLEYLLQGTLYPDVIESISYKGPSATIKTHHNVGGLPAHMDLQLIEPLRELFKDEVRELGVALGIAEESVWRHPFPGPGLAIRCLGAVQKDRLDKLRQADAIMQQEIRQAGVYREIAQAFCVFLPVKTVGVMGDGRTYENAIAVRCAVTTDFMTADWYHMDYDTLGRISTRIINEVRGINRVVYDISSKPPATIEWE